MSQSQQGFFKFKCEEDKKTFEMPKKFALKFGIIRSVLMDQSCEAGEDIIGSLQPVDVECSTATIGKILEWLEHHENDTEPIGNGLIPSGDVMKDDMLEGPTGWDKEFINALGCTDFYELVVAAIDLEVDGLVTLICREMAVRLSAPKEELAKALQIGDLAEYLEEEEENNA